MNSVKVYSTNNCSACKLLKGYLKEKGVEYTSVMVDEDESGYNEMMELSGGVSAVPQISINGEHLIWFRKSLLETKLFAQEDDFLSGVSGVDAYEVCENCQ